MVREESTKTISGLVVPHNKLRILAARRRDNTLRILVAQQSGEADELREGQAAAAFAAYLDVRGPGRAMTRMMKVSWKGVVLAPLAIPLLYSAAFAILAPSQNPMLAFLVFFGLGCFFSYGASVFLLLPCLFLVSRLTPLTARLTGLVGTVLGGVVYLPVAWQSYLASGDNSGPPHGSFGEYLRRQFFGAEVWPFLVGGLVTATLYWFLARQPYRRNDQPMA